jgi:hypothetical protein
MTLAQIDPRTDTSHQNAKNGRGMWPQCGVAGTPHTFPCWRGPVVEAMEKAPPRLQAGASEAAILRLQATGSKSRN